MASLTVPDVRAFQFAAQAEIWRDYDACQCREQIDFMLKRALDLLNAEKARAIAAEKDLFAAFGQEHQPTDCSRQFDRAAKELERFLTIEVQGHAGLTPACESPAVAWFGYSNASLRRKAAASEPTPAAPEPAPAAETSAGKSLAAQGQTLPPRKK